ncbi:stage II sporulation protein E [Georgenia soli]|uniref:Stage II sporulation protein E n=1 Tax=Georgenia soli TaxID=638953 RepID=A0A2A9ERP4_9MICO|nr:PP2C family protein-serine/threonine phosphatase [Georgenia soli]PFG40942.1 stage II sporulation protein E [Georgenia soli]
MSEAGVGRDDQQRAALRQVSERAGIGPGLWWRRYFALGGNAGQAELEDFAEGRGSLSAGDRDLLAQAVNELLEARAAVRRVPYSGRVRDPRPSEGPLAALLTLLQGMHVAPPDRVAAVVASAGEQLGVQIGVYLVDYDHVELRPLGEGRRLGVDASLPGRAFRDMEIKVARSDRGSRLWVPVVDGAERLGVLEVVPGEVGDLDDALLHSQLAWLATLLGHLLTTTTKYGDALDVVRRRQPRSASAELVWQLLPPVTAGTDKVVVTGIVSPSEDVGGDAFDYALSETTAHLAIFDANGDSLGAGAITAMGLSAYRSARRNGGSLFDQAMAVDVAIGEDLARLGRTITAVLAELDLDHGRLRWVSAGHPAPLLMRRGKVVKELGGGRRPEFGVPAREVTVAEETLEPGDWLVLYTDGITEARDADGAVFGLDRLEDFLAREAATEHPPPELVRRLVRDVLDHQRGVLQDDATVLVARWGDYRRWLTP